MKLKTVCYIIGCAIALLGTILVFRTLNYVPTPHTATAVNFPITVDVEQISDRLAQAIRFQTISQEDRSQINYQEFNNFKQWLAETYPAVHQQLELQLINDYTLLFRWPGKQANAGSILLSAHYDVVPVVPGTEQEWQHPPFAGIVDDTYIWGRGALDNKGAAVALMEAVNLLLSQSFKPVKDIYIAITHDEEIGSIQGAAAIAAYFKQQNIQPEWSLDEGSFVLQDIFPGVTQPVASINVAEKGILTLNMTAHSKGGHSSMPPQETAVSILAAAIVKLRYAPVPGGLDGISADMFDTLGRHMSFSKRLLFANRWLFGPVIESTLANTDVGNAILRTTTAPTMLSGSVKSNVLPITASAKINFRLHPRDSVEEIIAYVRNVIDDERIVLTAEQYTAASRVSSSNNVPFNTIAALTQQSHGKVIVVPGLTIAATDSRYYEKAVQNAYRFNPMLLRMADLSGFHGTNERISKENMAKATQFYARLIISSNGAQPE